MKYFLLALCFAVTSCNKCLECTLPQGQGNSDFTIEVCSDNPQYKDFKRGNVILQGEQIKCH